MNIFFLLVGLVLILAGANYLTDGSSAVAQRFRVPEFVIGLTIVAVGTSTPELVVSLLSALQGADDVAVGNVVGSNLFNSLVILGVCALIAPMALTRGNIRRDIPIGMGASFLFLLFTSERYLHLSSVDRIGRAEGAVMLLSYLVLMIFTVRQALRENRGRPADDPRPAGGTLPSVRLCAVMIVGGLAGLICGGELFLRSATELARTLGVSESVIAITLVAGGTSLPELASSVISILKGKSELALGNVVGSNIANILLILGLSATVRPLSMGGITVADVGVMTLSSVLLFLAAFTFRRRTLDRWEGAIFLLLYGGYIWYLLRG